MFHLSHRARTKTAHRAEEEHRTGKGSREHKSIVSYRKLVQQQTLSGGSKIVVR